MKSTACAIAVLIAALLVPAPPASAQARSAGVGGAASGEQAREELNLSMTVGEAYDDNLAADATGPTPAAGETSGAYTSLTPGVAFQTRGRRMQFGVNGESNLRYYPSLGSTFAMNQSLGAGMSARVMRKTTLTVNQSFNYVPTYLYGLFVKPTAPVLGEPIITAPGFQTPSLRSYAYGTGVNLEHTINSRTALSFYGDGRRVNFVGNGENSSSVMSAAGRVAYSVKQGAALRLGYMYREGSYSTALRAVEHNLEIGMTYVRPLSATRRWTVGFTLGPTAATVPFVAADTREVTGSYFRFVGDAWTDYQINRSWSARATYHRGLNYLETLAAPVYSDSALVETSGFLSRTVDLRVSASYATGNGLSQNAVAAQFATYATDARVRVALSRNFAVHVQGLFYDYRFDPTLVVVPGMQGHLRRSGVAGGFTMWMPVRSKSRVTR